MKKIQMVNEVLTEQLNHWLLFPIALTMMEMTRGQTGMKQPDLLLWLLCSLFPLCFFVLRLSYDHHKKTFIFLLWHVAVAAVFTFVLVLSRRLFITRAICILCGGGYMIHSLLLQLKRNSLYTTAMHMPIGAAIAIVVPLMRHTNQWNDYYAFSLIGATALFFLVFYMRQYLDFISLNRDSAGHLPMGEIFRSGAGLVLGYTLFGMIIMVVSTKFNWLEELLRPIFGFLGQFLRTLLKKLFSQGKADEDMTLLEQGNPSLQTPQLPPPNEAFGLWHILEIAVTVALIAGLAFIAVKLFLKLLWLLQNYLDRRLAGHESDEQETIDFRERCDVKKTLPRKKQRLSESFSNKERIRKLYKRKLMVSAFQMPEYRRSKGKLGLLTAREWEEKLRTKGMAGIYELARYSQRDVTADDVKRMKEACSEKRL